MTASRGLWLLYVGVALLLAWPALNGQFLSDDIGVMHWLLRWDASGGLWHSVAGKFASGLDVPSHYYRPLALVSFALDQRLFGWAPLPWHLTGFAIHLGNALLVGAVMRALGGDALRAATAGGLFLCFPLAPEVSIWFSGRYDVLAVTGMLIAVYGHLRASGLDRWRVLSLLGFALGLSAKEAAMPTPGLLVLASFLRAPAGELLWQRGLRSLRETLPAVLLFAAYLGLRVALFGSALQVYPDSNPTAALGLGEVLQRLLAIATIPQHLFADAPVRGAIALFALVLGLLAAASVAWRDREPVRDLLLPLAWTLLSLLSLVPHLSGVYGHGEGGRFYYATAAWLALTLAAAIAAAPQRLRPLASLLLVGAFAGAQSHPLSHWARAGEAMRAMLPQLAQVAGTLAEHQFALVVVPDHIASVPFARNAQGGIVMPPQQATNLLLKLVPVLPEHVDTWPQRIAAGDVALIKGSGAAPRLDAVFCFDSRTLRLERAETVPDWRDADLFARQWQQFVNAACPALR